MWSGYVSLGGLEIGNSARAQAYAVGSDCPIHWLEPIECDGLASALGEVEYAYQSIFDAPWYDPDLPASSDFLGAYIISIEGLSDSTATATVTEKILEGAQVSAVRLGSREVRMRLMLTAASMEAMELGMTWLNNTTSATACGAHSNSCNSSNLEFFVDCPPARGDGEADSDYQLRVDRLRRYLHTVTRISGPFVQQEMRSNNGRHYGRIVEVTFVAATPSVFTVTRPIEVPPSLPSVIQDIPYNLVPTPSAEIGTDPITVGLNYSLNPSLETNADGWAASVLAFSGADPGSRFTSGRSNDVAASGAWSYRARILGDGTAASGNALVGISHTIPVAYALGLRMSVSIWGGAFILSGPSGLFNGMTASVDWMSNTDIIRTDVIGVNETYAGFAFTANSLAVPPGATRAAVYVKTQVTWNSGPGANDNYDVRMYADAVALTVP